jgi:hypothetical protein
MREFVCEFPGTRGDHMSGSVESSQGFFSRRSFFRFSTSLAAGLGRFFDIGRGPYKQSVQGLLKS